VRAKHAPVSQIRRVFKFLFPWGREVGLPPCSRPVQYIKCCRGWVAAVARRFCKRAQAGAAAPAARLDLSAPQSHAHLCGVLKGVGAGSNLIMYGSLLAARSFSPEALERLRRVGSDEGVESGAS
jgi:hypothetical protein